MATLHVKYMYVFIYKSMYSLFQVTTRKEKGKCITISRKIRGDNMEQHQAEKERDGTRITMQEGQTAVNLAFIQISTAQNFCRVWYLKITHRGTNGQSDEMAQKIKIIHTLHVVYHRLSLPFCSFFTLQRYFQKSGFKLNLNWGEQVLKVISSRIQLKLRCFFHHFCNQKAKI